MVLNRYHIIWASLLILLTLSTMLFAPLSRAATETSTPVETPAAAPAFPGLSELGPRTSVLNDFVEKSENSLKRLADLQATENDLATFTSQLQEMSAKVTALGDPHEWYIDRLTQFNNQFLQLKKYLDELQGQMTERQKSIELIAARRGQEQDFWQQWNKKLKAQKIAVPIETVSQVKTLLTRLEKAGNNTAGAILKIQEQISNLQQKLNTELDQFAGALSALRKATFRKNAHSFFAPEFRAQFTAQLLHDAVVGWQAAKTLDWDYLQRYAWLFGLLIPGIALSFAIRKYSHPLQENLEWNFVISHPYAAGFFVSFILMANRFPAPPTQLRYALMVSAVIAGSILAGELVENRRQTRMLYLAGLVLMLTSGFRLINLPQPLYRMHIALLALITIPILISQIRVSLRTRGDDAGHFFRSLLRFAIGVLLISLIAQITGYMNFSSWLLQATFETGMVFLFAHMILRLGNGGISFLINQTRLANGKFTQRFGQELAQRLTRALQGLVIIYSVFYLLPLWRLFANSLEAWDFFSGFSISLGETRISVEMVTLALIAFYLAMQLSWLFQGLLETRFFYRKSVDRGVRDAIKKLMHYGMVTFGFLTVLSILGMGLQNFVVVLGAFGVGIGFGLQDIVNNFLSGLILLFERPVKVGDFIVVNEEWGHISKIGLRSTVVKTINHSEIIVPNSQLVSEKVTNWTFSSKVARLVVPVGVAYGSDVSLVMNILSEIAKSHPDAVTDPAPSILFMEFGDSSLNFEIRVFIKDIGSNFRIRSEMLQQIDSSFRGAGVEIPFPQRDLHLRSIDSRVMERIREEIPAEQE